jgi:hypothetical protein
MVSALSVAQLGARVPALSVAGHCKPKQETMIRGSFISSEFLQVLGSSP